MAAPKSQRIAIWIIAIILAVGTIGSFFVLIVQDNNESNKEARMQRETEQYQAKYQEAQDKQAKQLSDKYYKQFKEYESRVGSFKSANVKKLEKKDLKKGSGDKIGEDDSYYAYYIGWTPKGDVFDSSIKDGSLVAPLEAGQDPLIEGWDEGVIGMRKGGVRQLTIPYDKAYGSEGQGDDIPANTPLRFVIMIIEDPEPVEQPKMSDELMEYLMQQQQAQPQEQF